MPPAHADDGDASMLVKDEEVGLYSTPSLAWLPQELLQLVAIFGAPLVALRLVVRYDIGFAAAARIQRYWRQCRSSPHVPVDLKPHTRVLFIRKSLLPPHLRSRMPARSKLMTGTLGEQTGADTWNIKLSDGSMYLNVPKSQLRVITRGKSRFSGRSASEARQVASSVAAQAMTAATDLLTEGQSVEAGLALAAASVAMVAAATSAVATDLQHANHQMQLSSSTTSGTSTTTAAVPEDALAQVRHALAELSELPDPLPSNLEWEPGDEELERRPIELVAATCVGAVAGNVLTQLDQKLEQQLSSAARTEAEELTSMLSGRMSPSSVLLEGCAPLQPSTLDFASASEALTSTSCPTSASADCASVISSSVSSELAAVVNAAQMAADAAAAAVQQVECTSQIMTTSITDAIQESAQDLSLAVALLQADCIEPDGDDIDSVHGTSRARSQQAATDLAKDVLQASCTAQRSLALAIAE